MAKAKLAPVVKMVGGKVVTEKADASAVVIDAQTAKDKQTITAMVPVFASQFAALVQVGEIEDEEQYQKADALLGKIVSAKKSWLGRMEEIIRPISTGLERLHKLNREVKRPLEDLELKVKRAMGDYKLRELQRAQEEEEAKQEELRRLEAKKERVVNPLVKERIEEQIEQVQAFEPALVRGAHSASRAVRRVRVINVQALCKGIADGLIPADCVEVRQPRINSYHKEDMTTVEEWPGVEGYDDVDIAAR